MVIVVHRYYYYYSSSVVIIFIPIGCIESNIVLPDAEPGFETDGSLIEFPLDPGRLINELKILFDLDVEGILVAIGTIFI